MLAIWREGARDREKDRERVRERDRVREREIESESEREREGGRERQRERGRAGGRERGRERERERDRKRDRDKERARERACACVSERATLASLLPFPEQLEFQNATFRFVALKECAIVVLNESTTNWGTHTHLVPRRPGEMLFVLSTTHTWSKIRIPFWILHTSKVDSGTIFQG